MRMEIILNISSTLIKQIVNEKSYYLLYYF